MRAAVLLLLLAACSTRPPSAKPEPVLPDNLAQLLDQLGSEDIGVRERAEQSLVELGEAVQPRLRRELEASSSAEVQIRVRSVLEKIDVALMPGLPTEGLCGSVRIHFMHSFAWQNQAPATTTFVSTVWSLENLGETQVDVRIARARVVHKSGTFEVKITGTKLDPDPVYRLTPGDVQKPAPKMPECPPLPWGDEVYAVLDFADGAGNLLRLRTREAGIERAK